jgi:hypothetical protein
VTRFWPAGRQVAVTCDALATPEAIVWDGRRHQVACILERWRIDERWWRARAWREYFTLLTEGGLLLTLYHDVASGRWFVQRLYD